MDSCDTNLRWKLKRVWLKAKDRIATPENDAITLRGISRVVKWHAGMEAYLGNLLGAWDLQSKAVYDLQCQLGKVQGVGLENGIEDKEFIVEF